MAIDFALLIKNRQAFPPEELARYAGQWIPWAPDGSSLVVSHQRAGRVIDGIADSAADDTVFPLWVAQRVGIDLRNAPTGEGLAVGGATVTYRYVHVMLRISDGRETCVWPAIVGFLDAP